MSKESPALSYRRRYRGLVGVKSKMPIKDMSVLSRIYTPGVGAPCREIERNPLTSFDQTCRGNSIAIISDGSQVYGLGNIGALAVLPKLEAKSVIYKTFANVDAVPIALKTQDADEITEIVRILGPTFGGFCLESIAAPKCFTIVNRLRRAIKLPIVQHEQHGAAIIILAALTNALKVVGKNLTDARIVINGAGAAGIGVAKGLLVAGAKNIIVCDRHGAIHVYRMEGMNWAKSEIARLVELQDVKGSLAEVLRGADVFIGLSAKGLVNRDMVASMAKDAIVFALAIPEPEISEEEAKAGGAKVVATAHAESQNQIRSSLVTPGFFRGLLDVRARRVNRAMYLEMARDLAAMIPEKDLSPSNIIPRQMDWRISPVIAKAVAKAAQETGMARLTSEEVSPETIKERTESYIYEGELAWLPSEGQDYGKLSIEEESLELHCRYQGCVQVYTKVPIKDEEIYRRLYCPEAVAHVCQEILKDPMAAYDYVCKNNLVAIVSDGSAVLGLGNIGPRAALPVMEGKAVLFKTFGGVEAFPICISTQDVDFIVRAVESISPAFGGINLEDISSPRCFEVEQRLKESLDIPVFHDDQHGTAVVVLGALINALRLAGRKLRDAKIIFNGAGASAIATAKLLIQAGAKQIIVCDTKGAIYKGRSKGMNLIKKEMAAITNPGKRKGSLAQVLKNAEVFIGLSGPNLLNGKMVKSMAPDPIVFALANPVPEIHPKEAKKAGAAIVATGRSDFPNQVNNCLAFPGIFRGALDIRARAINDAMNIAAAKAIAELTGDELSPNHILPGALDFRVPPAVAEAVAQAGIETGVARLKIDPKRVARHTREFIYDERLSLI
ncbi:MAG: malic enzyme-like NAD(P)-binding protein [Syntrophobacterales bacterium]|jgi:malate dehydrogenase (oxaloacetate-decarboxylating)